MTEPAARALMLAAHSDPALDEAFPRHPVSICAFCGWLPQRHRVVDSVAGMLAAGDDQGTVADELGLSAKQVAAVAEWAMRWQEALP